MRARDRRSGVAQETVARAAAAAGRWQERAGYRRAKGKALQESRFTEVDDAERIRQRLDRLHAWRSAIDRRRGAPPAATRAAPPPPLPAPRGRDRALVNERVIGASKDLLSIEFFELGLDAARSVGRVAAEGDPIGTGFLVGGDLMMTNNHVLPTTEDAALAQLELGFEAMLFGEPRPTEVFELDPGRFFLTDAELDFALVAVRPTSRHGAPLRGYGSKPLIGEQGKLLVSQPVNIIQHPEGRPKEVVIRDNRLIDLFDDRKDVPFCHYLADTEPGSSGAPVYNDQWEIVALHHQGVPKTNADGDLVDAKGAVIREGEDPGRIVWVANEGTRVSRLVRYITATDPPAPAMRAVRDELLATWGATSSPAAQLAAVDERRGGLGPVPSTAAAVEASSVTVDVPLRITIGLGPATRR